MHFALRFIVALALFAADASAAPVPVVLSYQGRLLVSGQPYTGEARLRFVLVAPAPTPQAPAAVETLWSYDGELAPGGALPGGDGVPVSVAGGLYSVLLGGSEQGAHVPTGSYTMAEIAADAVFVNRPDVRLRVWVQTSGQPVQLLAPDRRITGAAYAAVAARVEEDSVTTAMLKRGVVTTERIAPGAIDTASLAPGAITAAQVAAGAITANALATNSVTADRLAPGAVTAEKLASKAVGRTAIADGAITGEQLAPDLTLSGTPQIASIPATTIENGTSVSVDAQGRLGVKPARRRVPGDGAAINRIGDVVYAPSSGDVTSRSTELQGVPFQAIRMNCGGGPVLLQLHPGSNAQNASFIGVYTNDGARAEATFSLWRDSETTPLYSVHLTSDSLHLAPPGAVSFMDQPPAGEHVYQLKVQFANYLNGVAQWYAYRVSLTAVEF